MALILNNMYGAGMAVLKLSPVTKDLSVMISIGGKEVERLEIFNFRKSETKYNNVFQTFVKNMKLTKRTYW